MTGCSRFTSHQGEQRYAHTSRVVEYPAVVNGARLWPDGEVGPCLVEDSLRSLEILQRCLTVRSESMSQSPQRRPPLDEPIGQDRRRVKFIFSRWVQLLVRTDAQD